MDNQSFWQSVLLVLISILQQVVGLFIWEKHQPVDSTDKTSDTTKQ